MENMKKYQKISFYFLIMALTFNLGLSGLLAAGTDREPIITAVLQNQPGIAGPLVLGLCAEDAEIMVYVDGTYEGNAEVNREQTGTDNFKYLIRGALEEGAHTVAVIAKDRTSLRLSNISNEYQFSVHALPAPTLIQPNEDTITGKVKPYITGLSVNNTFLHIFIDGKYNGKTEYLFHESGTANFKYTPFLNLAPGWHTAWAKAEDASGKLSKESNVLHFRIEEKNPAPTIIKTVVNKGTSANQPFITGLAKNNSKVRIFIDNKLNGEFLVINDASGTAHFSYKPFLPLAPGRHMVYATAVDMRGKESLWSNIHYFNVGTLAAAQSAQAETGTVAQEKTEDDLGKGGMEEQETVKEEAQTATEEKKDDSAKTGAESGADLKDILDAEKTPAEDIETGAVDENKSAQGKLRLNLIIFIIFLCLVIAWIFWVNRELIKERKEQNEKDSKK